MSGPEPALHTQLTCMTLQGYAITEEEVKIPRNLFQRRFGDSVTGIVEYVTYGYNNPKPWLTFAEL